MAVCESLLLKLEYISRAEMHSAYFYAVAVFGTLGIVTALGSRVAPSLGLHDPDRRLHRCSVWRFCGSCRSFPAEPKLGPVYHPVTHFIPWEFPLLVIDPGARHRSDPPAHRRVASDRPGARSPASPFSRAFVAVQWPFANFLMSPLARNRFFGTTYMDFSTPPSSLYARFEFVPPETLPQLGRGMLIALAHRRA